MIRFATKTARILILLVLQFGLSLCQSEKKATTGNHLKNASSPYLLEHADNPVDWYEWGDEALAKAKKENKPLIISVGYAACHWCHVMERESFMDTAVANYMNANFVAIKVDREERPDLDEIYLNAAQLITGNGGWPLNAFALPDGKPFYAATYFEKENWLKLLQSIKNAYTNDQAGLLAQSEKLTKEITSLQNAAGKTDTVVQKQGAAYANAFQGLLKQTDPLNGGFKGAPKFPMPGNLEFMLQYAYLKKDKDALVSVTKTLDKMAAGGIYDQLGGGFSRYTTDDAWHIPHFEKMLYDNAQLVSLYAHAYQYTREDRYRKVVIETLAFIKRELMDSKGGFFSSINADSEGKEGKFYVWKYGELAAILDKSELNAFENAFAISKGGNWEEGENILYLKKGTNSDITESDLIKKARVKLFQARSKRVRPTLDDKILTSWNALMLKAYVDAYRAIGDPDYLKDAVANAQFLEKNLMQKDFSLHRSFRQKKVSIDAFLEDYAFLADAMLYLYQTTFDKHWLDVSKGLTDYANSHFYETSSHFYTFNAIKKGEVLINSLAVTDGVIPSGNAVMGLTQYRLGKMLYDDKYEGTATKMLDFMRPAISKNPDAHASWALLLGLEHFGTYEIAILGNDAEKQNRLIQKEFLPNAIFAGGIKEDIPLLEDKFTAGLTRIYVCKDKVCKKPTVDTNEAVKMILF